MRSHPREKVGRNDPCPCGSGKKHKHCCLRNGTRAVEIEDTPWRRQRDASDELTRELMRFAKREFGDLIRVAWADFNQTNFPEPLAEFDAEEQVFVPYFLYDWHPDPPRLRRGRPAQPGVVITGFLERKGHRLSELQRLIVQETILRPLSFYEILSSDPGRWFHLRDVLMGEEFQVEEHSGSAHARVGDMLYGQVGRLPGVTVMNRTAPLPISPGHKAEVVKLRAWLRSKIARFDRELAAEDLTYYREKIRATYLYLRDSMRKPLKLCNTDGEPVELQTLTFRVGSAQAAFDALAPLAWGWTREELLEDAEFDSDGALRRVEFDWAKAGNKMHKTWDNTILGHIDIDGRTLVVNVNSALRGEKIRREIERRLGILAQYVGTKTVTQAELQERARNKPPEEKEGSEPKLDPEVVKAVQTQVQQEMDAWVYRKLPVLAGRTPMEAVQDPDGREIVEGLLREWERDKHPVGPGNFRPDLGKVRRLLNL